ncbi:MAG TPA: nuclear transport factor 2 family protein [Thermoleophilaceae bacterium]|nr:nuclear transport factor 2 family protein [Thermoleophilaceae bacterium]
MQKNADVVLAVFRAVEERNRDALLALHHDDVELHDAGSLPYGGTIRGEDTLRALLETAPDRTWLGTWGPLQPTDVERRMNPRIVATAGDEVTVVYTQRAVSPLGERFEWPVVGLYEVRDGKLARAQMFHYDTAAIMAFLERSGSQRRPHGRDRPAGPTEAAHRR